MQSQWEHLQLEVFFPLGRSCPSFYLRSKHGVSKRCPNICKRKKMVIAHLCSQCNPFSYFSLELISGNFLGAGVFGLIINLPIINYYEHGTYLTVNHGHAALMGVYGNLSLAVLFFCCRYMIKPYKWNDRLVRTMFGHLILDCY
jgi:heme/copper-type cytochrome/quinol oxidase subunit 1